MFQWQRYLEGKSLAKVYKCSFVEVSALLSMNTEAMWAELIKQIQVGHLVVGRPEQKCMKEFIQSRRGDFIEASSRLWVDSRAFYPG